MPILNIITSQTGLVGVLPSLAYIETNNTVAQVTTAGYLNKAVANGTVFSLPCLALVSTKESPSAAALVNTYQVTRTGANWSLEPPDSGGSIVLPTQANHLAVYTDSEGTLSEDATTAINAGNIQAGESGTAGYLASFPATADSGSLRIVAADNSSDEIITITNASHFAAAEYSIPDTGEATANFIMSEASASGSQTIESGSFIIADGNFRVPAGEITALNGMTLGDDDAVPGYLQLNGGANNGGAFIITATANNDEDVTVTNAVHSQSTEYTIPDVGAATGGIMVSTSPIRVKSVAGAAAAGGAAAQSFTDPFCTSASNVIGNWNTQANAASVLKIAPGNGSFVVTSTADAGAGTFNYIICKS